jgi:hypothetical protein
VCILLYNRVSVGVRARVDGRVRVSMSWPCLDRHKTVFGASSRSSHARVWSQPRELATLVFCGCGVVQTSLITWSTRGLIIDVVRIQEVGHYLLEVTYPGLDPE